MMKTLVLLLCLSEARLVSAAPATTAPPTAPVPPTEDESTHLVDWLMKYGYLPAPAHSGGQLQAWTAVTSAVRAMQRFAGLNDTGTLDEETMALMKSQRCSLPDQEQDHDQSMKRRRRAVSLWTRRNINWRLQSFPSSSALSRETVRSLVYYALRVWAEPTPLDFHEVGSAGSADLQVDFLHGFHGDGYPFDGAGGAVGHAFFPSDPARAGGVHLDAEEEWAFRQPASEGTDLFTVLVHEFGHALGLPHSSSRHSVMRPYYQGPAGDPLHYRLGPQDREHITQLYGTRNQLLPTDAPRLASEKQLRLRAHHHHRAAIDPCNTTFDAVAQIRGETFFFRGLTMWRVSSSGLVSARGAAVRRMWRALPPDISALRAVLERRSDHGIIFISGSQLWLFRDVSLQDGYPQPLSSLRMGLSLLELDSPEKEVEEQLQGGRQGLVWDPEEGPVWGAIGGEPQEEEEEADVWTRLLRQGVNGITTDTDGAVYLFSGASYWKFAFPGSAPQDGFPRSVAADWLDCPDPGQSSPGGEHQSAFLTPAAGGRQELREGTMEDKRSGEEVGQRKHVWTQCTCQSSAGLDSTRNISVTLLLCLWTVLGF